MSCQITLKENGQYQVNAPNGKESVLFNAIANLPEIEYEDQALDAWMKVYTDNFKEWWGEDWENLSDKKRQEYIEAGYLDINGEPSLVYRGDVSDLESFNYSPIIGKFGQGIYLAQNVNQAESFAAETGKEVYPVFLKPTKYKSFDDKLSFLRAVGDYHNIKTVPTEEQVKSYVESQHLDDVTIIGQGIMGKEFNTARKQNVKSIFTQGFSIKSGLLYDAAIEAKNEVRFTEEFQKERKSDQFIEALIQRLQNNLGLQKEDVEHITAEQAELITKDLDNPWTGQPAFYHNGKVYFVRGRLTYDTVIHEFAHPLVKAIKFSNAPVFNKIYEDLAKTPEGQRFIAESIAEYPELDPTHDQIKEEAIVKAMTYSAQNMESADMEKQPSTGLKKIIEKIIYALKQMFRKAVKNPIKVENLSLNTTVKELADMLVNEEWNLDMTVVPEETIASYYGTEEQLEEDLNKIFEGGKNLAEGFKIIDDNVREHISLINQAKRNGDYETIKLVLRMPLGDLTLDAIRKSMSDFSKTKRTERKSERKRRESLAKNLSEKEQIQIRNLEEELAEIEQRNKQMAKSLILMDITSKKTKAHVETLADLPDQKEAFRQIKFYARLLTGYERQVNNITETLVKAGLESNTVLRDSLSELKGTIEDAQRKSKEVIENGVSQILAEKYNEYHAASIPEVQKEIDILKKKKEKARLDRQKKRIQEQIDMLEDKKSSMLIAPDTMKKWMLGQMGDIGFISSQFENFISSQDPSIASLAAYVKENGYQVDVITQQGANKLLMDIKSDTDKLGISVDQLDKFSEQVLFKDKSTRRNPETGELETYTVWTLLNEHKNYKHTLAMLNEKLAQAEMADAENPTPESFQKVAELTELIKEHRRLYFRSENVDEYYEPDEELAKTKWTDPKTKEVYNVGIDAKQEANDAFKAVLEYQTQFSDNDVDALTDYETGATLLAEYRKLFSLYDDYGQKKTGLALAKAQALLKHRQAKRKFHEYIAIPNAFQNSLKGAEAKFKAQLESDGIVPGTTEYDIAFKAKKDAWLLKNTHSKNKDSFYEARERIFNKIGEIMDKYPSVDATAVQKEILLESLKGRKDDNGQPIGSELTPQMLAKIKNVEQEIEDIKNSPNYESSFKDMEEGDRKTSL